MGIFSVIQEPQASRSHPALHGSGRCGRDGKGNQMKSREPVDREPVEKELGPRLEPGPRRDHRPGNIHVKHGVAGGEITGKTCKVHVKHFFEHTCAYARWAQKSVLHVPCMFFQ